MAERLTKPTAASASRTRAPATPASTSVRKGAVEASPRAAAKAPIKARVGLAPARAKGAVAKAGQNGNPGTIAAQLHDEPESFEHAPDGAQQDGDADTSLAAEEPQDGSVSVHVEHEEPSEYEVSGSEVAASPSPQPAEILSGETSNEEPEHVHASPPASDIHSELDGETQVGEPTQKSATIPTEPDILDIVNLLETKTRSLGVADDAPEIPDEE